MCEQHKQETLAGFRMLFTLYLRSQFRFESREEDDLIFGVKIVVVRPKTLNLEIIVDFNCEGLYFKFISNKTNTSKKFFIRDMEEALKYLEETHRRYIYNEGEYAMKQVASLSQQ
jgi:hypothetical protein